MGHALTDISGLLGQRLRRVGDVRTGVRRCNTVKISK